MDSKEKKFEIAMEEALVDVDYNEVINDSWKKERKVGAFSGFFIIVMMFGMMGMYSVIRALNYGEYLEAVLAEELLVTAVFMILSAFVTCLFCLCFEFEEYSLKGFLGFAVVLMLLVYVDSKYLYNSIASCLVSGEKHWGYELVILPANAYITLKLCESIEREWSMKNNLLGLFVFITWNIFMTHLSSELYMSYQGTMIFTNALIFASVLFTAKTKRRNLGNRFVVFGIYVGIMVMVLYLKKGRTVSLGDYLFDEPGFSGYVAAVKTLFTNTKWIGAAYEGISMDLELLKDSSNSLHSISAYWGVLPAIIYFTILMAIWIIFGVAVYQNRKKDNNRLFFAVGTSAYAYLSMRLLLGTLHSLAICPLQVEMAYMGPNHIFDYCASAILLMLYFKNKKENGYVGPFEKVEDRIFNKFVDLLMLEDEWEDFDDEEDD